MKDQILKQCFVIMPISDQEGYDKGHFNRVYEHLIKPACENAGYQPIRANEEVKTNYIVIDIIKKILDSEMVLCDLSAKNPNVLYELGLRQAFNKKVVLIKDSKTSRIFDIQGFRTIDYDASLRIDEVNKNVDQISKTLTETAESKPGDINSLIQLLVIQPADLPSQINLSQESSIILDTLKGISVRLGRLEKNETTESKPMFNSSLKINDINYSFGEMLYDNKGSLGQLVDIDQDAIYIKRDEKITKFLLTDPKVKQILPF